MRCALAAATWARQQRLLMFLRGGYFGRLIYQWSRWCPNEFITCKEFACSSPQCLCALAREHVRVWMLRRSRTLPALLPTVPVTVGLRGVCQNWDFSFLGLKFVLHSLISWCVRATESMQRPENNLKELVCSFCREGGNLGPPGLVAVAFLLGHVTEPTRTGFSSPANSPFRMQV